MLKNGIGIEFFNTAFGVLLIKIPKILIKYLFKFFN